MINYDTGIPVYDEKYCQMPVLSVCLYTRKGAEDMLIAEGGKLLDRDGRRVLLRGVNLGGGSKLPRGAYRMGLSCETADPRTASYVGRPFPLEEADEHFRRLREWGLTFIRFIVTWEAVEHEGPGVYDRDYLAYLRAVIGKAGEHGLTVLIDPHQDVWSRWSGGDGAPAWTLESVGFDLARFEETCAAVITRAHAPHRPIMLWPVNMTKLAAATMFTLFFGGDDFAPETKVGGEGVQEFLQKHYIGAMKEVASVLCDYDFVAGYGTMNEPLKGYIEWRDLSRPKIYYDHGLTPSPFQSMLLGAGIPQKVDVWKRKIFGPRRADRRVVNREELRVWRTGYDCLWRANGVWDFDSTRRPVILRSDHFTRVGNRGVDFPNHYLLPFVERFTREMRSIHPGALIFFEGEPLGGVPDLRGRDTGGLVFAPHWYDGLTLVLGKYVSVAGADAQRRRLVLGRGRVRRSFKEQLGRYARYAADETGGVPVVIGEIGIPFDLDHGRAFHSGNFRKQVLAMDRSLRAAEESLLGYAIWNYTPDNSHAYGDGWNGEDLSIFSPDDRLDPGDINSGGRALAAVVRPYAAATAGDPMESTFNIRTRTFSYRFRHDDAVSGPTEIVIPEFQYPRGCMAAISDGRCEIDAGNRILRYYHSTELREHTVVVMPA